MGYSGGQQKNPDYHDLKDHIETTHIQFDSRVVSYKQLLKIFWAAHDYVTPIENQYRSAILTNGSQQQTEAEESMQRVENGEWGQEALRSQKILTDIFPATDFYIAELYHQKYFLQCNNKLFSLFRYKNRDDLTDCPVATSVNGYLHGSGNIGAFMEEVDTWPLPFAAKFAVLQKITEDTGLLRFNPIDESKVENPLPGPFPEFEVPNIGFQDPPTIQRTCDEILEDFSDIFPNKEPTSCGS